MDADQDYNIFEDCGEPPLPKMMSLPEQVKHLENSNSNLHVMLDTLTQENDTILKNALEAEATIGEANLMIMDMHNENCDLNNRIEDAEKRSAFNKIKISDLEKSLSEEKEAHQKLKNLLDSTIESFQKAEQKCEKYKALVDAGDENLQEVCARVVQARFEKQELETKLDRLNKREVMFLKQISNLKTQSLKFKEELSKEKEESSNLRDLLKKEKEEREVAELMEKSTTLQVELSKIDDDKWKDKMKKTLKKVTEEADMNKKEAEKNKKEAELLKKKMSEFNQDNEKLNKKVAQQISLLEKRNISLQASNDNLLLELKDLINKSKKDEINKEEIESYKIKIKEDIDKIIALEKHNISLQDTTENLFKEIENLSKINESFKKNSEEVELYKMKSKEDSDLISEISLKLQQSEENGVVMNDSVAKLQEQIAFKEFKIKEEMSKFEDMKKLHQQTMTKLNEEQIKVKSLVELQDSLCISNEKCIKLSAEVEVQQNVINSQVSLITNLETKLQGVEHRAHVAEVKYAEVTAQLEKTKRCHLEELQKLKETITSNKSQLVEYQVRISTLETLKEERKKQDEIESELNTEKAAKNSNELLAIKNVLNNIQVDFENQELKLKEKERILQQNNIFISGLTKELQELRSKISQQAHIIKSTENLEKYLASICNDEEVGKRDDNIQLEESGKCPSAPDVIKTEEATVNKCDELQKLVENIVASARRNVEKADQYFEQLSSSMVIIEQLTTQNEAQKTSMNKVEAELQQKILEIADLEVAIQKNNQVKQDEDSAGRKRRNTDPNIYDLKYKIAKLESKLCSAGKIQASLQCQLNTARKHQLLQNVPSYSATTVTAETLRYSTQQQNLYYQQCYGWPMWGAQGWSPAAQYQCNKCTSQFYTEEDLSNHQKYVHGKVSRSLHPSSDSKNNNKPDDYQPGHEQN